MDEPGTDDGGGRIEASPAFHPLVIGNQGDVQPSTQQVSAVVSISKKPIYAVVSFKNSP